MTERIKYKNCIYVVAEDSTNRIDQLQKLRSLLREVIGIVKISTISYTDLVESLDPFVKQSDLIGKELSLKLNTLISYIEAMGEAHLKLKIGSLHLTTEVIHSINEINQNRKRNQLESSQSV